MPVATESDSELARRREVVLDRCWPKAGSARLFAAEFLTAAVSPRLVGTEFRTAAAALACAQLPPGNLSGLPLIGQDPEGADPDRLPACGRSGDATAGQS